MPLRCLLFSSDEEMVQPIWQVLTDLGIEGDYCGSAVDAVEKVTTELFQIVITDWADQPEAAFLLKTARDQKAAQRPLTLAIVTDEARPQALQAGANSVLMKPIRPEQVRDTMSTACELLRSKLPLNAPPSPPIRIAAEIPSKPAAAALAAAAGPAPLPPSVTQVPEKAFRAGEFLQSATSAPGAQFVTECEVQTSLEQASPVEVDALTELEPTASAVEDTALSEAVTPPDPLTGWAALQARLSRPAAPAVAEVSAKSELLSFAETPLARSAAPRNDEETKEKAQAETASESALFSYMAGEPAGDAKRQGARPRWDKIIFLSALASVCVGVMAIPRAREKLQVLSFSAFRAGRAWLNPPPAPVPPAVAQHENFGQAGDEYKLPAAEIIPDATTDPSQIRVIPVLDPTAKLAKTADSGALQTTVEENGAKDQNKTEPHDGVQAPGPEDQGKQPNPGDATAPPVANAPAVQAVANPPANQRSVPLPTSRANATEQVVPTSRGIQSGSSAAIPSSLRSQTASMTPEASGTKPVEAALSSIEPVTLPESVAWGLLAQPVDPVYPEAAKASGQRGVVVLQVLIARDGSVQDAKFIQGSLVFARAAIDAVKQWRFKPYAMNGKAVSVQSLITLSFKPPA